MLTIERKHAELKALQWTGKNHRDMFDFLTGTKNEPMTGSGKHFSIDHEEVHGGLVIETLSDEYLANIGDWIVKEADEQFYPWSPAAFSRIFTVKEET